MSLTLDGKTLKELGLVLLKGHSHSAAPDTRDFSITIPGKHGAYDYGAELDVRQFELPLLIKERDTKQELAMDIRNLMSVFIDEYGKPKTIKLIFDYEPDVFYYVRYSGSMPIDRLMWMGSFVLPLTAFDPFKHFLEDAREYTWGDDISFLSDVTFGQNPYTYTVTSPQTMIINNFGTMSIRPTIEITGSATSLTLTANGKSFSFASFSNATFTLDGERYLAIKDGQNALSLMTGDFIELLTGDNSVSVSGSGLNVTIKFIFKLRYL